MAQDKLEIAKHYAASWVRGVFEASITDVDPDVEVDWSESKAPYSGIYRGHDGWRMLWSELRGAFADVRLEVHSYVVAGPHVAIHNTSHLRGRDDIEVTATSTIVLTFREDKIVRAKLFQEHADALTAIAATS